MLHDHSNNYVKFICLIIFTFQHVLMNLSTSYARTRPGVRFISSTAVVMAELIKLCACLLLVFAEEKMNFENFLSSFRRSIINNPKEMLKACVPSLAYVMQNNLFYLTATHLDAATNQIIYQLKIITTALFAMLILKTRLRMMQRFALVLLTVGVILVQLPDTAAGCQKKIPIIAIFALLILRKKLFATQWGLLALLLIAVLLVQISNGQASNNVEQNRMLGLMAALAGCLLSGFAGIYFEKILKASEISLWMRNVQLSLLSLPIGLLTCYLNDAEKIIDYGIFHGYDYFVWYLVLLQACGGLLVAAVVKYADNILKGFANSLAIIISCAASVYLFKFDLTLKFLAGAGLVIISIFLYAFKPQKLGLGIVPLHIVTIIALNNYLKFASLIVFTLQNVIMSLSTRYGRTRPGNLFLSSTAVLMSELVKLVFCLLFVYIENNFSCKKFFKTLNKTMLSSPWDNFQVITLAMSYVIQNNLFYLSASHLDAATNQITYQLKILTTALFAVLILKKHLNMVQWSALLVLIIGVALVQLANTAADSAVAVPQHMLARHENKLLGFIAALGVCFISGYAGIYFEKMLKESTDISLWVRNLQLSFWSIPFGVITCFVGDAAAIDKHGFFSGYDSFVWFLVCFQAAGGLIVAIVIKYADNILKCFAISLAILITCAASIIIFDFKLTLNFALGSLLVIISVFLYSHKTPEIDEMPSDHIELVEAGGNEEKEIVNK